MDDERWIVVDGRRWRRSDPSIPDALRQELVDELMAARRAVRAGEPDARGRVQDAKLALGERGYRWWEVPTDDERRARIEAATRALLRHRDGSTICPSDVARVVGGESWRDRMDDVRSAARAMDDVVVLQGGEPVRGTVKGPVRLGRAG